VDNKILYSIRFQKYSFFMNFGTDIQRSGQTEKNFFSAERVNFCI